MGTGFDSSPSKPPNSTPEEEIEIETDTGDFECNICFELAQDPIITLCGHLFCWACLYRWLHHHSQSQECPVCKAVVEENKLVPLYGRGKSGTDPRTRPVPGLEIPSRPSGMRPETAAPGQAQAHSNGFGFGMLGGFMPMGTARFGGFTMSAGFAGLFPGMMSFQFNGFPENTMFGGGGGGGHGFQNGFAQPGIGGHRFQHGHHQHQHYHPAGSSQGQDVLLKNLLMVIGFLVLLSFIFT